jgi:hypothetical protein
VAGREEASRGRASGGRVSWRAGGEVKAARGSGQRGSSPARGGGWWSRAAEKTERKGREEDDEDFYVIFQKSKGCIVK